MQGHRPLLLAVLSGSWGHNWDLPEPVGMESVAVPFGTPISHPRSGMEQRLEVPHQWGPALPPLPAARCHGHGSRVRGGGCSVG